MTLEQCLEAARRIDAKYLEPIVGVYEVPLDDMKNLSRDAVHS